MPNFVKTVNDEKYWAEAKQIAIKKLGKDAPSHKIYAYANAVFHKIRKNSNVNSESLIKESDLPLYSQIDYTINNLKEDEMWHAMKHILFENPKFNRTLDEAEQYTILEYLFNNYKQTINNDDYSVLKEYIDSMVIPEAKYSYDDKTITYGVMEEDYISGGFGGLGSAEYGYGGVGYAGGRGRRRGFGGPRQGGQMSRRSTGNPFAPSGTMDEPIEVDIDKKESNYKPWNVKLTPDGNKVTDVERNKVQSRIESEWEGELGAITRGLEMAGLDLDELEDMSQEEIEDVITKKLKQLGKQYQQELESSQLQESISLTSTFKNIIKESFSVDYQTLEEKLRKASRIQDARDILSSKHNYHKAIEKNKDHSYIIDQYGIDRLMRKFGYSYDESNTEWLKISQQQKIEKPKDIKHRDIKTTSSDTSLRPKNGIASSTKTDSSIINQKNDTDKTSNSQQPNEKIDNKDYTKIKGVYDPVSLESKLKPLMARYILCLGQESKTPCEFTMSDDGTTFTPKISDEKVINMMIDLKCDWDSDKDIWVDDTNTLPVRALQAGETRKSLSGRAYLASMGEFAAIQFDMNNSPLFTIDEVDYRMFKNEFEWDQDINKWTFNNKDLANSTETLNESILFEQVNKKSGIEPAIPKSQLVELQARYLYRLAQYEVLNAVPDNLKDKIKFIIDQQNPLLFSDKLKPLKKDNSKKDNSIEYISIEDILKLLSMNKKPSNNNTTMKEAIKTAFYEQNDEEDEEVELSGEQPNDEEVQLSGDEESEEKSITPKETQSSTTESLDKYLNQKGQIVPLSTYEFDNMWKENGKLPNIVKQAGDDIQSYMGRPVLAVLTSDPEPIQIKNDASPVMNANILKTKLEDYKNINWFERDNIWIRGTPPTKSEVENELTEIEQKLKEKDLLLLQKYNNGQGFDIDNLPFALRKDLMDAIIGQYIMKSGVSEKEWYAVSNDNIKATQNRQQSMINKFKNKNKVFIKQLADTEKTNPAHTHKIVVEPRKSLTSKLKKVATDSIASILKGALRGGSKLLGMGIEIAARLDGYQGPLPKTQEKFPFVKSGTDDFWQSYLDRRKLDMGSSSRVIKPK